MAASLIGLESRPLGLRRRWWLVLVATPLLGIALASWWFAEPLTDHLSAVSKPTEPLKEALITTPPSTSAEPLTWPEARLDGPAAKTRLLKLLTASAGRLDRVETYTATFKKQERLNDVLGPVQTMAMKVRQKPFAVYFKFITPQAGKEVVYAEGHHDNKLIAHAGSGLARFLAPRVAVAPDHPLALSDARHPVTEAGLANLTARLLHFRELDLDDPEASTVLDRTSDANGRVWFRSIHTHPHQQPGRPFARVEVLYDPKTLIPVDVRNFDWPVPGQTGEPLLAEHYQYDDLNLDATLSSLDFDPANPAYAFHRY